MKFFVFHFVSSLNWTRSNKEEFLYFSRSRRKIEKQEKKLVEAKHLWFIQKRLRSGRTLREIYEFRSFMVPGNDHGFFFTSRTCQWTPKIFLKFKNKFHFTLRINKVFGFISWRSLSVVSMNKHRELIFNILEAIVIVDFNHVVDVSHVVTSSSATD